MDTMRREMIWAGGLFACVLAVAIGARAADSVPVKVELDAVESTVMLMDHVSPGRLVPLPKTYSVKTRYPDGHPARNALAGAADLCSAGENKAIYSSTLGTFGYRPGEIHRGTRIADDLITELIRDCSICSLRVRVTGGVEDGDDTFRADFSLYDACPDRGEGGTEIPGTLLQFSELEDDAGQFHDLILDYSDRGICADDQRCQISQQNCRGGFCDGDESPCDTEGEACGDGSECVIAGYVCVEDPLEIPPTVWVRFRFDTEAAMIVMGSPPTTGFSGDAYDDPFGAENSCTAWFGGWPVFPHATIFAEIIAPATCETHFLAYLAANPAKPAFLPSDVGLIPDGPAGPEGDRPAFTTPTTRLADDIRLTVDSCTLSAYELGMKGNAGEFAMEIDLRWPDVYSVRLDTVHTFEGRGEGSAEISHFTIPEDVNLGISINDQPIKISWKSNKAATGAMEVNITQAGTSNPTMLAFDVDLEEPNTWSILPDGDFTPAVFYAAIFCRGDAPRGACCPNQPAIPGADMFCFDDVPVTSCLGTRWQINSTCEDNAFNPSCGTHACCLPNANCEDRTLDDCVEECTYDVNPISCEPVCNGGPKHRLPCIDDTDCTDPAGEDDGICDEDALCPGQRTCGITGCQLNGEFTGRPCDLNNPLQGDSDCMTCSSSGEYCRPRCTDGLRWGRPCDPANGDADCPGSTCDVRGPNTSGGFDCPVGQTCNPVQECVHDDGECSLRCSRWSSGRFCGEDNQECPNFACFDAVGDCFEDEGSPECMGRCSESRPCTSDDNCSPDFGTCLPSGRCSGYLCFRNDVCEAQSLGSCLDSDVDCPIGTRCLREFRTCTGREGCDNLDCCKEVCSALSECCDNSDGQTWDGSCVSHANLKCTQSPGNDDCHSNAPNEGAFDIPLENDDTGLPCAPGVDSCSGAKIANNKFATSDLGEPGFCCNQRGVNVSGAGSIWFKFEAMHETALIHTCRTDGSATVVNSLIQVFKALDQSPEDDSDLDECESLEVIACNDDAGVCGSTGENCPDGLCLASLCAVGLNVGEIYYIQMAASKGTNQGVYKIDIESPCPSGMEPPPGGICATASDNNLPDGPVGVPFDLAGAELDCPAESELPDMTNDLWFLAQATCAGNLIVQTCGLGEPNPETTLAVYRTSLPAFSCPPLELVGWNDDATHDPICSVDGRTCDVDGDCIAGCTNLLEFRDCDPDCPGTSTCDSNLMAQCETVPGRCNDDSICDPNGPDCLDGSPCDPGIGDSSNTRCGTLCTIDADCPGSSTCDAGTCDPIDAGCTRGVCEDDEVTPCDSSFFGRCEDGAVCDGVGDCLDGSDCENQCGWYTPDSRPAVCLGQEVCVAGHCGSSCAPASYVVVPTFVGQWYFIRIGGASGSEPSGTVRLSCVRDDCNNGGVGNGVPDGIEILNDPSLDCNLNATLDECDLDAGLSDDCNCNDIPDECEIDWEFDCATAEVPCDGGPFFCFDIFDCAPDLNDNGVPDCCDVGFPPDVCPLCPTVGACCNAGVCTTVVDGNCTGEYAGDGTACEADTCTIGSCCDGALACRDDEVASQCGAAGETFRPGDDCITPCDPVGACCDAGACTVETAANCSGVYQGDGTACEAETCTIGSCCDGARACRDDEVASQCGAAGEEFRSGVDCTTACPSCTLADLTGIVFADADPIAPDAFDQPGHCDIDAREPHLIADVNARSGWDRMVMSFSCDPTTIGLASGDFTVDVGVPGVLSVVIDNVANTATVMLDDMITPGQWTCIDHAGFGGHWCMGYLPADAGQDNVSAAGDVTALINSINLVPGLVLPMYASDINRSGVTTGADILRLIDLLNGAGDFTPWIAQNIGACPP